MIKAVLFDFDGTLVDSAHDLAAAANQQRSRQGLTTLPYEKLRPFASQGARGLLKVALDFTPEHPQYEVTRQQFLLDYRACMTQNTHLFDGVNELLLALEQNNVLWGIVTNKVEDLSLPMFEHLALLGRSTVNVCGDTTGHSKPHPEPLLYAAKQLNLQPTQCVYVGDDLRDIQAGKAAGMATIAVTYGYSFDYEKAKASEADLIVTNPNEIFNAVLNLGIDK